MNSLDAPFKQHQTTPKAVLAFTASRIVTPDPLKTIIPSYRDSSLFVSLLQENIPCVTGGFCVQLPVLTGRRDT
jgi:hypothetical protein